MVRLLRLKAPLRGGHSGCPTAKSGGFADLLRVSRPLRVPKNFWAGVTRHVRASPQSSAIIRRVTLSHIFFDPDDPDDPDESSIYAGFRESLTLTKTLFILTTLTETTKTTTFMGKELTRCTMVS